MPLYTFFAEITPCQIMGVGSMSVFTTGIGKASMVGFYWPLWAPFCYPSLCFLYVMNLIDDYSGYHWTWLLKAKSNSLCILCEWLSAVKVQMGEQLWYLVTDNSELHSQEVVAGAPKKTSHTSLPLPMPMPKTVVSSTFIANLWTKPEPCAYPAMLLGLLVGPGPHRLPAGSLTCGSLSH